MKILLATTHLRMGGIGIYTISLARALKAKGHKVFVASGGGELARRLKEDGIAHFKISLDTKSELSPKLLVSVYQLFWHILEEGIDVLHTNTRVSQVAGEILSHITKVSHVSTCHGFFRPRAGRRIFGCWGKKVIAISEAVREHLVNDMRVKKPRIALIHNGIDIADFNKRYSPEEVEAIKAKMGLTAGHVVGIIARLSSVKGHKYLIKAVKELIAGGEDVQLLIVGEGPEKDPLKKLVKGLEIEKDVVFMDSVMDTTMVLSALDVFVLPSIAEGLGLALLEALAYKVPAIASDAGGIYSIIKDGTTGLLVPPKSVEDLAEAITILLNDRVLAACLAENGRKLVEENFSLKSMVDKVEAVYKDAAEG